MNREIIFRGKRVNTGEWVFGCLTQLQQDQVAIYDNRPCASSLQLWQYIQFHTYEVIPETVGQFTGLYDNTKWEQLSEYEKTAWLSIKGNTKENYPGRKIFEGDILIKEGNPTYKYTVEWKSASFQMFSKHYGFWHLSDYTEMVVIGNIYDNKELLNG